MGTRSRPGPECPGEASRATGTDRYLARLGDARTRHTCVYRPRVARVPSNPGRDRGRQTGTRKRGGCRPRGHDPRAEVTPDRIGRPHREHGRPKVEVAWLTTSAPDASTATAPFASPAAARSRRSN